MTFLHRRFQNSWRGPTCRAAMSSILALTFGQLACAADAELSRGPYLQLATPNSIVVVWRTRGPSRPLFRFGESPDALDRQIKEKGQVKGEWIRLSVSADVDAAAEVPRLYQEPAEDASERDPRDDDPSTSAETYQYEAHIGNLKPATRYYYAIYDGQRRLAGGDVEHYFVTSPLPGSEADMRIWVVGDSGTGGREQKSIHLAMQAFTQDSKRDLDLYLHLGDMAYGDGTDAQFQNHFFDVYQSTLRNTVCWPTMGNHEGHTSRGVSGFGPYYDAYVVPTAAEAGGLASGTEAYYSFNVGDVHFICLDSHDLDRTPDGAMAQWLIADLEEADGDWMIAFWHHPPYTKGSHDSDLEGQLIEMRTHIMPILESGGVDVVMAGHSHIYERSMLLDGAYDTPTTATGVILNDGDGRPNGDGPYRKSKGLNPHEGTVAIVAGHGGASLSRRGTMPVMREIVVEHGSVILDVKGDVLTGVMVNRDNVQRDLFSIVKQGKVEASRIENPWKPVIDYSQITHFLITFHEETPGEIPSKWEVVHGSRRSAVVETRPESKAKQLAVSAADERVVVVYNQFHGHVGEYETRVTIPDDSTAPAGLVLGYEDPQNYYVFRLDRAAQTCEMVRFHDGKETILSRRAIELDFNNPIKVELESLGDNVEVQIQDAVEYMIKLEQPLPPGLLGVYVAPNGSAIFPAFGMSRGNR